jgi:Uma2 family endonuclease
MTLVDPQIRSKPFIPGTTGWTAVDLDDPAIERQWFAGRYEIIEGVLTVSAAAYFSPSESLDNLVGLLRDHFNAQGLRGGFGHEVDIIIDQVRVVRADAVYLDRQTKERQRAAALAEGRRDFHRTRILVPPTLVIESVSPGHEDHDRNTKWRWYAEFGVPNYWILDFFARSLECLVLDGGRYCRDVFGHDEDVLQPTAFPGLSLPLRKVWEE